MKNLKSRPHSRYKILMFFIINFAFFSQTNAKRCFMSDTINLLKECDAGIKMGIEAIDEVISHVKDEEFKSKLINYKKDYNFLQDEIQKMLDGFHKEGKDINPIVVGMSKMKTGLKIAMNETDATIADLMTDGCNMGVKSLHKYLNEYKGASDDSKELAKKLIRLMDRQEFDIRKYSFPPSRKL